MTMTPLEVKFIALLVVTFGSLIFGCLPPLFGLGRRYADSAILSAVLCFGGGVLFATSVVHILPDVRNDMPKWSELVFCVGFLLIFFVDSIISFFEGDHGQLSTNESSSEESLLPNEPSRHYGAIDSGTEAAVGFSGSNSGVSSGPPKSSWLNVGLLMAFTIHALLEGLVIGIQDTEYGVALLLGAVCSHKLLVAFCLSAEIVADGRSWEALLCPMGVFIFGSDLGIVIGMIFQVDGLSSLHTTVPLLEGLAGGTLLYIALCEILPRERKRKLPPSAGLGQFTAFGLGFCLMSALTLLT